MSVPKVEPAAASKRKGPSKLANPPPPEVPDDPELPDVPEEPDEPDVPELPEEPLVPEEPDEPDVPLIVQQNTPSSLLGKLPSVSTMVTP